MRCHVGRPNSQGSSSSDRTSISSWIPVSADSDCFSDCSSMSGSSQPFSKFSVLSKQPESRGTSASSSVPPSSATSSSSSGCAVEICHYQQDCANTAFQLTSIYVFQIRTDRPSPLNREHYCKGESQGLFYTMFNEKFGVTWDLSLQ